MIHGEGDRCTPLGQAQELYAALLERGVESELVVYPREGHGLRERDHQLGHGAARLAGSTATSGRPVTGSGVAVFVMRRFAVAVPTLLIIFGVFALVLSRRRPGALPARGARRTRQRSQPFRERYHLDDPFLVQYFKWLSQVVQGDLGSHPGQSGR